MDPVSGTLTNGADSSGDRLDSWKEIAAYLRRGVSTVQRWEQEEGLPVRRHLHGKGGSVYAYRSEIDLWWESRRQQLNEGERPQPDVTPGRTEHSWKPRWARLVPRVAIGRSLRPLRAAALSGLVLLGTLGAWNATRSDVRPITTVAVLPLKNITGNPADDWFAEGVTDALNAAFSQVASFAVISSTTAARYAQTSKTAREIARDLGVDGLVEGTVLRSGTRVRITVGLVDGGSERRVWSATYEREMGDVLALYEDLARALAAQVNPELRDDRQVGPTGRRAVRRDAYEAYLRGHYFRQRRQMGGCVSAERYLRQAVALDPDFAEPHADLAFCYGFDRLAGQLPASEAALRANREAARALQLHPVLADAHVSLALIRHRLEFDWAAAEQSLRRALDLAPSHAHARSFYAELLWASGRVEEGLRMQRSALALQPFDLGLNVGLGYALYNLRRYDEAAAQLRKTVELDPTWHMARFWLAETYAASGLHDLAVNEYSEWLRLVLAPSRVGEALAKCLEGYRKGGPRGFWLAELELAEEEERRPNTLWHQPYDSARARYLMARRYARVGNRILAQRSLWTAYEGRSYLTVFLNREPLFDSLRSDPEFEDLLQRVGFEPKKPVS